MKRREAIKQTAAMMGMTILGADIFLTGCSAPVKQQGLFSTDDIALMDQIGETILPDSDRSPGAKAAHIGEFMKSYINNCYGENDQEIFMAGLAQIQKDSQKLYHQDFLTISDKNRFDLLSEYDQRSRASNNLNEIHFFTMMKQVTILGYFSSEVGATKAMRYNIGPGHYNGCAPYKDGDKALYGYLSSIG